MNVLVIGGGPAGIMAAGEAAKNGHKVYIVEKNGRIGKKLRITGKGRCNITNACPQDELLSNVPTNPSFLYSAFYGFSNTDLISFVESLGVKTKIERGMRVFPESDSAVDVIEALKKYLHECGVKMICAKAVKILTNEKKVCGVALDNGKKFLADAVVIATGGKSYPQTGSDGYGYVMAEALGHTVVKPSPSLVPLTCREQMCRELTGLALKNIGFRIMSGEKTIYKDFGELLFTHFGISGPVVLSASAHMRESVPYQAVIDLKPALTEDEADKRILRDFEKYAKKDFINSLDDLLPKKLIHKVVEMSGIDPRKNACEVTREERRKLVTLIKSFTLTVSGFRPIEEAIITSGGIKTSEINPKTMESKLVKNLFFAGEIIDVDAYTGGFNLQIAFSTGYAAGNSIGE